MKTLSYGRQTIDEDDIAAVTRVLRSDYLTTGPEVEAFERELAEKCGAKYAVAVSSGTAALHCAYAAAGIRPGDEVITSPLTFAATANMILALRAKPVFADIDEGTLCLDPGAVKRASTLQTRAVVPVDFGGHPAAVEKIRYHGIPWVIEDAAHSLGGSVEGRPQLGHQEPRAVGSQASMTVFSFHPVKNITCGEGGAVVTDDELSAIRIRQFRNHGRLNDAVISVGFNYRLSDIHAALGRSQLRKLDRFVARRAEIVTRYREGFVELARAGKLRLQQQAARCQPAWHLFVIMVEDRDRVMGELNEAGIRPQIHYPLVTSMPLYRGLYDPKNTPVALRVSEQILSLPLYPSLTNEEVDYVIAAVERALA